MLLMQIENVVKYKFDTHRSVVGRGLATGQNTTNNAATATLQRENQRLLMQL
jgi:hypothetical protein